MESPSKSRQSVLGRRLQRRSLRKSGLQLSNTRLLARLAYKRQGKAGDIASRLKLQYFEA